MEQKNKHAPHWIFYVIAVLLAVIAALLVALLLKPAPAQTEPATTGQGAYIESQGTSEPTQDMGLAIDGRWITLYLPRELEGVIVPVRRETDGGVAFSFTTQLGTKNLELFSLDLSTRELEGYRLGTLKGTSDGDIYVYTSVHEQPAQAWSQEEYARIDALQQRINDLIAQFYEDARFQAAR